MDNSKGFTLYDEMMQTKEQQMLKSMLPYLDYKQRQNVFYIILLLQIEQSKKLFAPKGTLSAQEIPQGNDRIYAMLNALKDFCNPKERETVETILNLFCLLDNYDTILN